VSITVPELESLADTVAEFSTYPAVTSAARIVYGGAVQVVCAAAASVVAAQVTVPSKGSEIAIPVSVSLPVLVSSKL